LNRDYEEYNCLRMMGRREEIKGEKKRGRGILNTPSFYGARGPEAESGNAVTYSYPQKYMYT
jgi:hypothetical protein